MILPHDYVNYVKISWNDGGVIRLLYPTSKTSNPLPIRQDSDGNYDFGDDEFPGNLGSEDGRDLPYDKDSTTWTDYSSSSNITISTDNTLNPAVDNNNYFTNTGERYGIDPQHVQINGSYYIDCARGMIHFSSIMSGKTIILDYISDSLGTDGEMVVHKFAEEAMYKSLMYAILSTRSNIQEYVIQRYKKERFAAVRKAKLRLSNIKLEEITQILRGKSKFIKH